MYAAILQNTATGRFHPIVFRRAPMPGNSDGDSEPKRYKSRGHHTEGFESSELAVAHIGERKWTDTGARCVWDGEGVPALIVWIGGPEL